MKKLNFRSAGDLLDYIDIHWEELEVDDDEGKEAVAGEEKIAIATFPSEEKVDKVKSETASSPHTSQSTLREETENLYRRSMCLVCHKNRRCFVILPCSHFTLCAMCEPSTRKCPIHDCQELISCTIQTYV